MAITMHINKSFKINFQAISDSQTLANKMELSKFLKCIFWPYRPSFIFTYEHALRWYYDPSNLNRLASNSSLCVTIMIHETIGY